MIKGEEFTQYDERWVCVAGNGMTAVKQEGTGTYVATTAPGDDGTVIACKKADYDKLKDRGAPLYCVSVR